MPPKKKRINKSKFQRAQETKYLVPPDLSLVTDPEVCPQTREGRYAWLNAIAKDKIPRPSWFENMVGLAQESLCSVNLHRDEISVFTTLDIALPMEDRRRIVLIMEPFKASNYDSTKPMIELEKAYGGKWVAWAFHFTRESKEDVTYAVIGPKLRAYPVEPYEFQEFLFALEAELPTLRVSQMFGEEVAE